MTQLKYTAQLKYTIAHIKVGAENYWEEVEGFVSGDKESLLFDKKKIDDIIIRYAKNNNHPLFNLANKLGANIYGGFQDENDFYLIIPTVKSLKAGDLKAGDFTDHYMLYFLDYSAICEPSLTCEGACGFHWQHKKDEEGVYIRVRLFNSYCKKIKIKGNIFQEYARTGILNNDIYKQFFK